jgi:hypothetical protein
MMIDQDRLVGSACTPISGSISANTTEEGEQNKNPYCCSSLMHLHGLFSAVRGGSASSASPASLGTIFLLIIYMAVGLKQGSEK